MPHPVATCCQPILTGLVAFLLPLCWRDHPTHASHEQHPCPTGCTACRRVLFARSRHLKCCFQSWCTVGWMRRARLGWPGFHNATTTIVATLREACPCWWAAGTSAQCGRVQACLVVCLIPRLAPCQPEGRPWVWDYLLSRHPALPLPQYATVRCLPETCGDNRVGVLGGVVLGCGQCMSAGSMEVACV